MLHIFCLHFWQSKKKKNCFKNIFTSNFVAWINTYRPNIFHPHCQSFHVVFYWRSKLFSLMRCTLLFCAQPHSVVLYKCGPVDFLKAMLILKAVFLPSYCIAKRGNPQQTWSSRAENCWKLAIEMVFSFLLTNKHLPIVPCCSSLEVGNSLPFHILATISCTWVGYC